MKSTITLNCGIALASAALAALCVWGAAGLAGDAFFHALAVFSAAFWGSLTGIVVWDGISRWGERKPPPASIIWPRRRRP